MLRKQRLNTAVFQLGVPRCCATSCRVLRRDGRMPLNTPLLPMAGTASGTRSHHTVETVNGSWSASFALRSCLLGTYVGAELLLCFLSALRDVPRTGNSTLSEGVRHGVDLYMGSVFSVVAWLAQWLGHRASVRKQRMKPVLAVLLMNPPIGYALSHWGGRKSISPVDHYLTREEHRIELQTVLFTFWNIFFVSVILEKRTARMAFALIVFVYYGAYNVLVLDPVEYGFLNIDCFINWTGFVGYMCLTTLCPFAIAEVADDVQRRQTELHIRAQQASQQSQAMAVMFHELRNPLNGTVGHLRFAESELRSPTCECPKAVRSSLLSNVRDATMCCEHTLKVLQQLNHIQKWHTTGVWPVDLKANSLKAILLEVHTMCTPAMQPQTVLRQCLEDSTQAQGSSSCDRTVLLDGMLLREVLINLIQNAARFTQSGLVEFGCRISAAEMASPPKAVDACVPTLSRVHLNFFCRDTGCGIPPAALETLFDRYTTTDGLGLGLMLSKIQVQFMGGTLSVRSPRADTQNGTEFTFGFDADVISFPSTTVSRPCAQPPDATSFAARAAMPSLTALAHVECRPSATPREAASLEADSSRAEARPWYLPPNLHVLIADDVQVNLIIMKRSLERCQDKGMGEGAWSITTTQVAEEAVELFGRALTLGSPYDLVILDEHFDKRSALLGSEAILQMRQLEHDWTEAENCSPKPAAMVLCTANTGIYESKPPQGADSVWLQDWNPVIHADALRPQHVPSSQAQS